MFGNPWTVAKAREVGFDGTDEHVASICAGMFRNGMASNLPACAEIIYNLPRLRGKSLACWCRLCPAHAAGKPFDVDCSDCAPCHADTLGWVANGLRCE